MPYVSDQGGVIAVGYVLGLDSPDTEVARITLLGQNPALQERVSKSIYICEQMDAKRPKYRWSLTYKVPTSEFLSL